MVIKTIIILIIGYCFELQFCNENWFGKMFPIILCLLLSVAGLIALWIREELFAFWMYLDRFYIPVICPSLSKRESLIKWSKQRLPKYWSSSLETLSDGILDFWNDGSLLCTLINTAFPGACPNPYRHWKNPPVHAQEVAYKYLGMYPVFTETELCSPLSKKLETKLLKFLIQMQSTIECLEENKLYLNLSSAKYAVRGMGLYTAEQNKECVFFIYPKIDFADFSNIVISIQGPYSSFRQVTVLTRQEKTENSKSSRVLSNGWLKAREIYLRKLRMLDERHSNDKSIDIRVNIEEDRAKVAYVSKIYGIHEISLSCNKETIIGSPFYINVLKTSSDELKNVKTCTDTPNQNNKKQCGAESRECSETIPKNETFNRHKEFIQNINDPIRKLNTQDSVTVTARKNDNEHMCNIKNISLEDKSIFVDINDFQTNSTFKQTSKDVILDINRYYGKLKVCRITRKPPKLAPKIYPLFSSASPICLDHIAPEEFRKLSVEEKRKKYSSQRSSALDAKDNCVSSSFSGNEKMNEPVQNSKAGKNKEQGNLKHKKNVGKDTSNENRSLIFRIVQEKKQFWETISNSDDIVQCQKSKVKCARKTPTVKASGSSINLRNSSSFEDLKCIKRRRNLTYKSIDENLETCSTVSIKDRKTIYLNKVQDEYVKLKHIKTEENGEFNQEDTGEKGYNQKSQKIMLKDKKSAWFHQGLDGEKCIKNRKSEEINGKIHFKSAVKYFENLDKNMFPNTSSDNLNMNKSDTFTSNIFKENFSFKKCPRKNCLAQETIFRDKNSGIVEAGTLFFHKIPFRKHQEDNEKLGKKSNYAIRMKRKVKRLDFDVFY